MKQEEVEMTKKYYQALYLLMEINNYYISQAKQGEAESEEKYIKLCKYSVKLNQLILQLKIIFREFSN